MKFEDLPTLLTPEKLPYLSGVERLQDGVLHVAVLTRMPRVSPAMISWWFGEYMQTTEHYKRWHPRDHVWMSWEDKQPGTHVGAKHLVHEYIGGRLQKLRITFVPEEHFFGNTLAQVPDALAVCGRPGLLERPIDLGRMVHLTPPQRELLPPTTPSADSGTTHRNAARSALGLAEACVARFACVAAMRIGSQVSRNASGRSVGRMRTVQVPPTHGAPGWIAVSIQAGAKSARHA